MSRSPLAEVNHSPNHFSKHLHPEIHGSFKKVRFDAHSERHLCFLTDFIALELARNHEKRPSTIKMSRFSETLDLKSASAWDKFSLERFGVEFKNTEHTPLNILIWDSKFYDPNTENTKDFEKRDTRCGFC